MDMVFDGRPSESPLVETIWRTQSERASSFMSTAASNWEMVITRYQGQTHLTVRGPETQASPADVPPDAEFFGIIFKLGTHMPHLPIRNLLNRNDATLPSASSKTFWLNGSVWQFPDYDNADTFIHRLTRNDLVVREPLVTAALHGQLKDVSLRSVQRRFVQVTGLTHKAIQQIERAQKAMELLQKGVPILDTTYQLGYFDQSHLTNALKRFIGQTPAQIIRLNTSA